MARFAGSIFEDNSPELVAGARNLREPFPVRQDIFRDVPTKKILDGDGNDKYPGFEIRQVMPKASLGRGTNIAQIRETQTEQDKLNQLLKGPAGETIFQQKIDLNEGDPYRTDPNFIQEYYPVKNRGVTLAQLTPSMMDPIAMDEDELMLRDMGVPQIRSLDYEKQIIKTPSTAGAQFYYDQARPGGPF